MLRRLSILSLIAVLLAVAVACGGQGGGQGGKKNRNGAVPVGAVVKKGDKLRDPVVQGRAYPLSDKDILLSGKQFAVFGVSSSSIAKSIRKPGAPSIVRGQVRRLTPDQVARLSREVARLKGGRARPPKGARLSNKPGDPYLRVTRIDPAPGKGQKAK